MVGHNASGAEISTQIARTAKQPVLVSVKQLPQQAALVSSGTEFVPDIVELLPDDRCIRFADGRLEHHMDRLVFCTGYYSTFPFLDRLGPCYNGYCTQKLYQHIFYIPEPSIAFAAMPLKSTPFPLAESQAAVIARVWSGRLKLPSQDNMLQWDANLLKMHGDRKMTPHEAANFNASLMNTLYDWSLQAERRSGLDKDGNGKLPTRWNEKDVWLRSQLGPIKVAFSAKGSERHNITTPKELGFDFQQDPAS